MSDVTWFGGAYLALAVIGTVWLSTNPTPHAANHALDDLVADHGHTQALRLWCTGIRLADATNHANRGG